jgi:hypothetical protein
MIKIKGIKQIQQQLREEYLVAKGVAIKGTSDRLVEALKDATPVDTGEARDGWKRKGNAIVNEVPHIKQLNDGSSVQAPAFFIEQTVLAQSGVKPNGTIVKEI